MPLGLLSFYHLWIVDDGDKPVVIARMLKIT